MNLKYILILLIFSTIPMMLALDIENNIVTIKVFNTTFEIRSLYTINNINFTVNITNGSIDPEEHSFNNYFISNRTQILDLDVTSKMIDCQIERTNLNVTLGTCLRDLNLLQNASSNYQNCLLDNREKSLTIDTKQSEITAIKTQQSGEQNQKWVYLGIGLAVGLLLWAWQTGKFTKIGRKSENDFTRGRAG